MCARVATMKKMCLLIAVVLAVCTPLAFAGLVSRPTKTCGNTTYVAEVAGGCPTIKSSEVDADFAAVITGGVNNIETANINAAGLGAAALATGSVTSAKILDGTIVNADVNAAAAIAGTKLAVGAATHAVQSTNYITGLSFSTVETVIATVPSITTRGAMIIVGGSGVLNASTSMATAATVAIRLKRDGVEVQKWTYIIVITPGAPYTTPIPVNPMFIETPTTGSYVYTVTAQSSTTDLTLDTGPVGATGFLYAMELS